MKNLFNFDYETQKLQHRDGTDSNFSVVYGEGGNIMHCKKDSYQLIGTEELSKLGQAFLERGNRVNTFTHRNGEVIGLNINFGQQMTKVGDKSYNALITVPNNGGGRGYLSIKEVRLICTNGMVRSQDGIKKEKSIKIPHNFGYETAIKLMEDSLVQFDSIISYTNEMDETLLKDKLDTTEVRFLLNRWYYEMEMPTGHKADMTFNQFREALVNDRDSIQSVNRYEQLMQSYQKELQYSTELNLDMSKYTVVATVTNYLSRRIEESKSTASQEVQFARQSAKIENFSLVG